MPRRPAMASLADEHAAAGGVFHLVWLDSRDGPKGLRYARSSDGGAFCDGIVLGRRRLNRPAGVAQ